VQIIIGVVATNPTGKPLRQGLFDEPPVRECRVEAVLLAQSRSGGTLGDLPAKTHALGELDGLLRGHTFRGETIPDAPSRTLFAFR
jgi:hypothetical protein